MARRLRDLLAIQEPKQIPEAREADQALGVQGSAGDLPRHQNRRAHPGAGGVPVFDNLGAIILNALLRRAGAGFVYRVPIRAGDIDAAQRDPGKVRFGPFDAVPINHANDVGKVRVIMVIEEQLLEDVHGA